MKELKKGHHALAEKIWDRRLSYIGHRHVTRICSDYYGKGIVRSNQESTNLRAYASADDVTAAESIATTKTCVMPGASAVTIVEKLVGRISEEEFKEPGQRFDRGAQKERRARVEQEFSVSVSPQTIQSRGV